MSQALSLTLNYSLGLNEAILKVVCEFLIIEMKASARKGNCIEDVLGGQFFISKFF